MTFVRKARCRRVITTPEKLDNDRFLLRSPGDTHVSLGLFSLRNGLASNVFVYTNIRKLVRDSLRPFCCTWESASFCSVERNRVLGGLPLTCILYCGTQIRCLLFRSEVICWVLQPSYIRFLTSSFNISI